MDKAILHRLIPKAIRQSLRYRLLAFLLLSLLVLMSLTMVAGQRTADHEFGEILDGQMITTGRALFSIIALELRQGDASTLPGLLDQFVRLREGRGDWIGENSDVEVYDNEFYFQLVDPSGTTLFASIQPPLLQGDGMVQGLFRVGTGDDRWHLFGLQDAQTGYTFYTGQSQALRYELSSESIRYILLPFGLFTVVILGAIWVGTGYGLKPLVRLTQELDRRTPNSLDTIEVDGTATELRPMVVALNRLFLRVSKSMATERQFSADASHELRTPLAGIKANLDAAKILSNEPEQVKFLNNIDTCVDNATEVTEGLLLLSRLQSMDLEAYFDMRLFNFTDTIRSEISKRVSLHPNWNKRINFNTLTKAQPPVFKGPESLAAIAVGNILDNALNYSEHAVDIELHSGIDHEVIVIIKDQGPGIPENQLDKVFERFYRINSGTKRGFGLGLALVQQIMGALGGSVKLANHLPTGIIVTLIFPGLNQSKSSIISE